MPKLGEKLYNKLINELLPTEKKIGNTLYTGDEKKFLDKTKELQESLHAMALVFEGMANASTGNDSTLFLSAHQFCKDMADAVGDSPEIEDGTVDIVKGAYENINNYDDFDKALEVLFPETDKPLFAINNADPDLPKNSSYAPKIEYNQNKYNNLIQKTKEKGRAIPIGIGEQLIKGIKGLQTYIKEGLAEDKIDNDLDNDLNEKIKHVEEVIQQPQKQQQKLESIKNENEHKNDIFKKDKSDLIENNIIDNKKSDIIAPIKNSGNSKTASEIREMHNFPITFEANSKSYRYSGKFVSAKTSEEKGDWLAKAAAVNVLMQIGIKDTRNPKPTQIFTEDNINEVAAAVKKLPLFKGDMNELENKVFQNKYNPNKMFMLMEQEDINELIVSMGNLNINFGSQKTGPATNQSPQLNQGKNIDDMNTNANDKKSNGKKTGMKP